MFLKRLFALMYAVMLPQLCLATVPENMSQVWADFNTPEQAQTEPSIQFPFEDCFRRAATTHNLPLVLLIAVARGESDFNPRAVSHADARGIMQILWPVTAQHLGLNEVDIYDPCKNVDAGARYLREMLERYNGDLHLALAAYNYGPQRIAVGATKIPEKADWYSRYIFDHLAYVIGADTTATDYQDEQKLVLIEFDHPYLAEKFVDRLELWAPEARIDIFRSYFYSYRVVLLYVNRKEYERSRLALERAGLRLPEVST